MALLGIQAGRGKDSLETLDYLDNPQGTLTSTHTHTSSSYMHIKFFYVVLRKKRQTDFTFFLGSLPSCHPDDLLLCRLIQKDSIEGSSNDEITNHVEEALALRRLSTRELLKLIQDTIDGQMERIEDIGQVLHGDLSTEGIIHMRYYAMIYCTILFLLRIELTVFYHISYVYMIFCFTFFLANFCFTYAWVCRCYHPNV